MTKLPSKEYLNFWGKARSEYEMPAPMHPAAYHSLDVAAVASALQGIRGNDCQRICTNLDIPRQELIELNTFLIALHDIGKFSRTFQGLVPEFWPSILSHAGQRDPNISHWQLSYDILSLEPVCSVLHEHIQPQTEGALKSLLRAIAGHHGRPPSDPTNIYHCDLQVCESCENVLLSYLNDLLDLLHPPKCEWLTETIGKQLSFWLSGLTNTADWIGSNQNIFKFHSNDLTLHDYWHEIAIPRAEKAIDQTGLRPAMPALNITLKTLFNIDTPRPMQVALEDLALPNGPVIVVIEDATGAGKTEAATLLAQKMMQQGKAGGLYFALPTMATANAMYQRMAKDFRNLFESETAPSLALAHGKRELILENFKKLNMPSSGSSKNENQFAEQSVMADCSDWIADDRRKTFLAEIGVGTIDQALMAVLPLKFQALRLWALSDRIMIIDEAHAYDAYMSKELETLLEFHAAHGGSAIILTATLTAAQRESLINGFEKGLKKSQKEGSPSKSHSEKQNSTNYPLVTTASENGRAVIDTILPAPHTIRTIHINRLSSEEEVIQTIKSAAERGAAIAWVRNAVDDAISAYDKCAEIGLKVDLFHARFIMGDRQQREQDAINRFGPMADPEGRKGRVLIATQVIEQSLDLDFDLMISDLAPIDLLIQRAGRLWRHMDQRPESTRPVAGPTLHILSPDPEKVTNDKWLRDLETKGSFTYPNHALLWRTANILFNQGSINAPKDLRPMLEYVYADPPSQETPHCLRECDDNAEGAMWGDLSLARINLLDRSKGYTHQSHWLNDEPTRTRLGDPTLTLRLARVNPNSRLSPYCESDDNPHQSWALSEITVRASMLQGLSPASDWHETIEKIRNNWPKSQRHILLIPIDKEGFLLLNYQEKLNNRLVYGKNGLERLREK